MEKVDLTEYVDRLVRRWRLVIVVALAFTLIAAVVIFGRSAHYQANTLVAMTGSRDLQRLSSLVQFVPNPLIAEVVLDKVGGQLPVGQCSTEALLTMVEGKVPKGADSVQILVTHRDPQIATLVANAWGEEYIRYVNEIYKDEDQVRLAVPAHVPTQTVANRERNMIMAAIAGLVVGVISVYVAEFCQAYWKCYKRLKDVDNKAERHSQPEA